MRRWVSPDDLSRVVLNACESAFLPDYEKGSCPASKANWRLSDVLAARRVRVRSHVRLRAGRVHAAAVRVNTLQGAQLPAVAQDTRRCRRSPSPFSGIRHAPHRALRLVLILAIGFALSRNRKAISWRVVAWGVGLQDGLRCVRAARAHRPENLQLAGRDGDQDLELLLRRLGFVSGKSASSIEHRRRVRLPDHAAIIFVSALFAIITTSASCRSS